MLSQDIRRSFLQYFKERGHAVIPSSSVVPHDDPTLLFTNAGMNQFKDVFLGKSERDYKRAATSQKCIRVGGKHNDLDNVGHTSRHLTFFEMLGNFSFGDYFKEKAIEYAWEASTKIFRFSPEHIWITIFQDDDEAFELWQKWIPAAKIVRLGEKDNFWAMGDTGPCGPCSELYYDRGEAYGNARSPKEDVEGERYLEFWNLVFMQYNRDPDGKLTPLPKQSIDTGAGLERVVSLKMGVNNLFETDIFKELIAQIETVTQKKYVKSDPIHAPAFHVIADHIRSLSFAIADGAQPGNVERGYVLRKILRRAVRYGRTLGMQEPFLARVLPRLVAVMGEDYRELASAQDRISEILTLEEESFIRTLKRGGGILNSVIEQAQKDPLKQISGEAAFKLKDTYGLPLEEILLIAKDTGLKVNLDAYTLLEEQAKEKSRSGKEVHVQKAEESLFKQYLEKQPSSTFVGYTETECEGSITGIILNGAFVQTLEEGEEAMIILDKTSFYAEKGGQVGDTGTLSHHKALFKVTHCETPYPNVIVHKGKLEKGVLIAGEPIVAKIDARRRDHIASHHTATHLLHWALGKVLGEHIRQAGSLVEVGRLRFDFSHHKPLTLQEMRQIEDLVNEKIREDKEVSSYELSYEEAQKNPHIKQFFGEKYGNRVRVVDIDFSQELCGGTHVMRLGTIGYFRILKESSIAAGMRRIEAVTGKEAENYARSLEDLLLNTAGLLKTSAPLLPEKINVVLSEQKSLLEELKKIKRGQIKEMVTSFAHKFTKIGALSLLAEVVTLDAEEISLLIDLLLKDHPHAVFIFATKQENKCQLFIKVAPDLVKKGVQAGAIAKEIAPLIGGSGGGKPDSAQAGGKKPEGIHEAFEKAKHYLSTLC